MNNKFSSTLSCLLVSTFFFGVGGCANESMSPIPESWQEFDVEGRFIFRAPNDFVKQPGNGIDSLVVRYANEEISLICDYGWYSTDYTEMPGQWSEIDGKSVYLISSSLTLPANEKQSKIVYFPYLEQPDENGMRNTLQVIVRFDIEESVSVDMLIRSIRFSDKFDVLDQ